MHRGGGLCYFFFVIQSPFQSFMPLPHGSSGRDAPHGDGPGARAPGARRLPRSPPLQAHTVGNREGSPIDYASALLPILKGFCFAATSNRVVFSSFVRERFSKKGSALNLRTEVYSGYVPY